MNIAELVSVVTPAYNASDTLPRAIESVLTQDPSVPYFVVDDCSSDEHKYELGAYTGVTLIRNTINLGGASTRNIGLAQVKTPYVLFLDADDYILPETIDELARIVQDDKPDMIFFPWYKLNFRGSRAGPIQHFQPDPVKMHIKWLSGEFIPPCAIYWRTDFLKTIGSWAEGLRFNDDGELVLRALLYKPTVIKATIGGGVYTQGVNPKAVSNSDIETKIDASIHIFEKLRELINNNVEDCKTAREMTSKMGEVLYYYGRVAYERQLDNVADLAITSSRALGYKGYFGTYYYKIIAFTIGPRFAETVVSKYRRLHKFGKSLS